MLYAYMSQHMLFRLERLYWNLKATFLIFQKKVSVNNEWPYGLI